MKNKIKKIKNGYTVIYYDPIWEQWLNDRDFSTKKEAKEFLRKIEKLAQR